MLHIQRFIDRLQGFESRGQKDFIMPIKDAKDLHTDITRLLMVLETLRDQQDATAQEEVIKVTMEGGTFK